MKKPRDEFFWRLEYGRYVVYMPDTWKDREHQHARYDTQTEADERVRAETEKAQHDFENHEYWRKKSVEEKRAAKAAAKAVI